MPTAMSTRAKKQKHVSLHTSRPCPFALRHLPLLMRCSACSSHSTDISTRLLPAQPMSVPMPPARETIAVATTYKNSRVANCKYSGGATRYLVWHSQWIPGWNICKPADQTTCREGKPKRKKSEIRGKR